LGTFLSDPTDVPHNVVVTLASQLNIADWTILSRDSEGEMRYDHVREIMAEYGYLAELPRRSIYSTILMMNTIADAFCMLAGITALLHKPWPVVLQYKNRTCVCCASSYAFGKSGKILTKEHFLMYEIRWDFYPRVAHYEPAQKWVELLVKLQKAPKTVDAYARGLDDLLAFFERTSFPLVEATRGEIASYLNDLHNRERLNGNSPSVRSGLSHSTIQQRLTVARLWYDYLIDTRIRIDDRNPVGRGAYTPHAVLNTTGEPGLLRHQIQEPWIPGDDEWNAFLDVVLREERLRNQAMVFLAYDGALRRSELVGLHVSDIDWPQQSITVRAEITKNGLRRTIFYGDATQELLTAYMRQLQRILAEHGGATAGPLFTSESHRNPGCPLSKDMWNKIVERIGERANLPSFKTHTFRHLRLTDFAHCQLEIYEIALLAGHRSIESTQLYLHMSPVALGKRVRTVTESLDKRLRQKLQKVQHHDAS